VANNAARRVRACILEIIPSDVVDYAMDICNKTRKSNANITPEKLENLVKAFGQYGVGKAQIEDFIQRRIGAIKVEQYLRLRDIYASLKDGVAKPENFFKEVKEVQETRLAGVGNPSGIAAEPTVAETDNTPSGIKPDEGVGPEAFEEDEELF